MSVIPESVLADLARVVATEMRDRCVISRETPGPGTFDDASGEVTIVSTHVYSGPCLLGDRIEGAFASGGFGGNPQEWAADARSHTAFLRLPVATVGPEVGDLVDITGGDRWRITARERGTHRSSATFRLVRYDLDASRA